MTHSQKRRRRAGTAAIQDDDNGRDRSRSSSAADRAIDRTTVSEHIAARPGYTLLIAIGAGFALAAFLLRRSA